MRENLKYELRRIDKECHRPVLAESIRGVRPRFYFLSLRLLLLLRITAQLQPDVFRKNNDTSTLRINIHAGHTLYSDTNRNFHRNQPPKRRNNAPDIHTFFRRFLILISHQSPNVIKRETQSNHRNRNLYQISTNDDQDCKKKNNISKQNIFATNLNSFIFFAKQNPSLFVRKLKINIPVGFE